MRIEFQTSTCQEGFPSKVLVLEDGSLEIQACVLFDPVDTDALKGKQPQINTPIQFK